jgi:hypothetical protein
MRTIIRKLQDGITPMARSHGIMSRLLVFSLPILFLVCIPAFPEDKFWEKKDYRQWSRQECQKLLKDSPWAKTFTIREVGYGYDIQFRSALPIRQAIVRQMQIAENYESLSPERRSEFNKRAEGVLSPDLFADAIIVHVRFNPLYGNNYWQRDYWQTRTTDLLKNDVFLIPSTSGKIPLLQYKVSQAAGVLPEAVEFQFIFPRQYKGRSLLSTQDEFLRLEFHHPVKSPDSGLTATDRVLIEFKTNEMRINGEVMY